MSLERALGQLEGEVSASRKFMEQFQEDWRRQDAAATAGRKELYRSVEQYALDAAAVSRRVTSIEARQAKTEQVIDEKILPWLNDHHLTVARRDGMWLMGKLIWGAIATVAAVLGYAVHELLVYLHSGTPWHFP